MVRIVYKLCIYKEYARQKSLLYTSLGYDIITMRIGLQQKYYTALSLICNR